MDTDVFALELEPEEYARYLPIRRLREEWDHSDARLQTESAEDDPTYRHKVSRAIAEMNNTADEIVGNDLEMW